MEEEKTHKFEENNLEDIKADEIKSEETKEIKKVLEKIEDKEVKKVPEKIEHISHHQHKPSHLHSHKHKIQENLTEKMRENPWVLSTIVLGILSFLLIVGSFSGGVSGKVISESDAGQAILDFASAQVDGEVELTGVETFGDYLYEVTLSLDGQDIPLYLTKDGENLVQGVMPMASLTEKETSSQTKPPQTQISKSDKPRVELFVMTHCPYGTQAEKGFIPAMRTLADTADVKIRFVHYFMHKNVGEEPDETPRQVCIREEQSDKYLDYLECFLEDGDSSRCLTEIKIDEDAMNECIDNGNAAKYYEEDSALSNSYGVRGSPTLIINGDQSTAGRDSASYLEGICNAFNTAPEECDVELSSVSQSPGFGYSASGGGNSAAQCG